MPKMKTRKGAAKRVKITARGKVTGYKTGASHLKSRKSSSQLRSYRKKHVVAPGFTKTLKTMLGM